MIGGGQDEEDLEDSPEPKHSYSYLQKQTQKQELRFSQATPSLHESQLKNSKGSHPSNQTNDMVLMRASNLTFAGNQSI